MLLRIKLKGIGDADNIHRPLVGWSNNIEVVCAHTGKDMRKGLRSMEIHVRADDIATVKLEYSVAELDIDGEVKIV